MRIYSTETLGATQSLTPEGYLLCEGVAIARTGAQIYAGFELPSLVAGMDGLITVHREEAEVFRPETMASFEGKSVTIGHSFVDPDNWGDLTKGTLQNVRRGVGDQYDLLISDMLITDAEAIRKVRAGSDDSLLPGEKPLREVSCGYDAEYVQDSPGVAYQREIIGNHAALVPRGRAGPRCSIQDGEIEMTAAATPSLLSRLMRAVRTGDAALIKRTTDEAEAEMKKVEDEESEAEKKKTEDALATLAKTVDALTLAVASLVKTRDEDKDDEDEGGKKKTEDGDDDDEEKKKEKTATGDAMRALVPRAEILAPGFSVPTADSVANMAGVASVQRRVLAEAMKTADGKTTILPLLSGRTVDALPDDVAATVFLAASEMTKQKNNARGARQGVSTTDSARKVTSIADMNARNAEFWKRNNQA